MAAKSTKRFYNSKFHSDGDTNNAGNYFSWDKSWSTNLTDDRSDAGGFLNWRELIRENRAATTPVNGRRWIAKQSPGRGVMFQLLKRSLITDPYIRCPVYWNGYPWPTRISGVASATVITDGVADRIATKKFFRKYNSVSRGSDGLVSLGELRETLRMLRKPAESLMGAVRRDYLDAVKRHKRLSPKSDPDRWKRALSGLWLEQSFGWRPLLNDISGVLDALDLYNESPVHVKMITAVGKQKQVVAGATEHFWSPDQHDLMFSGWEKKYLQQKVKYRGKYVRARSEITNLSTTQRASEAFGLELSQFVPAAWELLPWSFLIDYFSNIGDILEQSFTDLRYLAWCNKTVVNDGVYELEMALDKLQTKAMVDFVGWAKFDGYQEQSVASTSLTYRQFARGSGGPSVQRLAFELPGSPMKWLNMAALAVQANSIHPQKHFSRK